MDIETYIKDIAKKAKHASVLLRGKRAEEKNSALQRIADLIQMRQESVIEANRHDLVEGKNSGLSEAFLDRLELNQRRVDGMVQSLKEIAAFEDPVGQVAGVRRPQGFILERVRIPIGVVAMIYESRPNVTVEAAALCLKAGNSVILRGGSAAMESNKALAAVIREGLGDTGVPPDAVQLVERREHEGVTWLVKQAEYVDIVIPRGGESLIRTVAEQATVPVIKHYKGVCHLYIDERSDIEMALSVVHNAKVQRPGTCNALETLLVHKKISAKFLPRLRQKLENVELRGCERTKKILKNIAHATEQDFYTEYSDLVMNVKIVDSIEEAIAHIEKYGSSHTDGILSEDTRHIQKFVDMIDSAVVTVNASTRLSDGGVFGLGAEIGISTDKLHARGPMGLGELTSYKWVVRGNGDLRT
jgi:glutamate-5-semialdehyde dehydrogenase